MLNIVLDYNDIAIAAILRHKGLLVVHYSLIFTRGIARYILEKLQKIRKAVKSAFKAAVGRAVTLPEQFCRVVDLQGVDIFQIGNTYVLLEKTAEVIFTVMKLRRRVLDRDPFTNSLLSPLDYFKYPIVDRLVFIMLVLI